MMVIDLFRELDEHPVEVVPNPSSPAFFAVLPTVLKRAYSLVSIRRRLWSAKNFRLWI